MGCGEMHHRSADFHALYTRVLADLKTFIGTRHDVVTLTCSGTGAMEASVSNLTSPGDKVLAVSAGKFGERWRDLAKAYGCTVDVAGAPYGQAVAAAAVAQKLRADTRIVYMQATESSTGARLDVEAVARLLRGRDTLLVVDAITGLGTTRLDVDSWGVDVILGGSQKALMIPPGLAYCAVSERAWERMQQAKAPRFYFDLQKERAAARQGEASYTPAISLIAALGAALESIREAGDGDLAAGRDALIANAELAAEMTRAAARALDLELFAPQSPAAALTAIVPPAGVDAGQIVRAFREKFGAQVADGQGEMKGRLFRIAHLGYYDYMDTIAVIGALEHVLVEVLKPRHLELGSGLRAAQSVYARAAAGVHVAATL